MPLSRVPLQLSHRPAHISKFPWKDEEKKERTWPIIADLFTKWLKLDTLLWPWLGWAIVHSDFGDEASRMILELCEDPKGCYSLAVDWEQMQLQGHLTTFFSTIYSGGPLLLLGESLRVSEGTVIAAVQLLSSLARNK